MIIIQLMTSGIARSGHRLTKSKMAYEISHFRFDFDLTMSSNSLCHFIWMALFRLFGVFSFPNMAYYPNEVA